MCSQGWELLGVSAIDVLVTGTMKGFRNARVHWTPWLKLWNCELCMKMFPDVLFLEKFFAIFKAKKIFLFYKLNILIYFNE